MSKKIINIGASANDKSGDPLRVAFGKINDNFTELYSAIGADVQIPVQTGNGGKYLTTNGTTLSWATVSGGSSFTHNSILRDAVVSVVPAYTDTPAEVTAIELKPAGANTDQFLRIYPTVGEGNHVHLSTGNLANEFILLGDDAHYVEVTNLGINIGTNGGGYSQSGEGKVWAFNDIGQLALPYYGGSTYLEHTADGLLFRVHSKETVLGWDGSYKAPIQPSSSRTGNGNNLKFPNDGYQKIISTDNGTEGHNTVDRLVISGGDSYQDPDTSAWTGEGGDIYLWAGRGADGGDIKVDAGDAYNYTGGTIKIRAGTSYANSQYGGSLELRAGNNYQANGIGGSVSIYAGGANTGTGGTIGNISLTTVGTWTFGSDGNLTLPAGGGILDSNGSSVLGGGSGFTGTISEVRTRLSTAWPITAVGGDNLTVTGDARAERSSGFLYSIWIDNQAESFLFAAPDDATYDSGADTTTFWWVDFYPDNSWNGHNLHFVRTLRAGNGGSQVIETLNLGSGLSAVKDGSDVTIVSTTGNIKFTTDVMYDLGGLFIENADLSHGATAAVALPANGSSQPVQINNTYGSVRLGSSTTGGNLNFWEFSGDGKLHLPGDGTIMNTAGTTTGTLYTFDTDYQGNTPAISNVANIHLPYNANAQNVVAGWIITFANGQQKTVTNAFDSSPPPSTNRTILWSGSLDLSSSDVWPLTVQSANYVVGPSTVSVSPNGTVSWLFNSDGVLKLPAGSDIVDSNSISVIGREPKFEFKNQTFYAEAGHRYAVDNSGLQIGAILPASPAVGDAIYFVDAMGTFSMSGYLVLSGNGNDIMGAAAQNITTAGESIGVFWNGTEWRYYG